MIIQQGHLIPIPSETEARSAFAKIDQGLSSEKAWAYVRLGGYLEEEEGAAWCPLTAIKCFEQALELAADVDDPILLANIHMGLGKALFSDGIGYQDPIRERAIDHLETAQGLLEQLDDPEGAWTARFYRACALAEFLGPRRYSANEGAICELEALRQELDIGSSLILRANLEHVLGNAYIDRAEGNPINNTKLAEICFRRCLRFFQRAKYPTGIAQANLNLAIAYNQFGNFGDNKHYKIATRFAKKAFAIDDAQLPSVGFTELIATLVDATFDVDARNWRALLKQAEHLLGEGIQRAGEGTVNANLLKLVRAGIYWQASQYRNADRYDDIHRDLAELEGAFSPFQTAQWWLERQELCALYHSFMANHGEVLAIADETLSATQAILDSSEDFAEHSLYLALISVVTDMATKAYLDRDGPFEALTFARRTYGTLLGFSDLEDYSAAPQTAEIYLLNPIIEDFCYILLAHGDNFESLAIEGIGARFWHQAQDGDSLGLFSGVKDFERTGNANLFAEALSAWVETFSGKLIPVLEDLAAAEESELQVFAFGGWCTVPLAALTLPNKPSRQLIDQMALFSGPNLYEPKKPEFQVTLHLKHPDLREAEAEDQMLAQLSDGLKTVSTLPEIQSDLTSGERYDLIHFTAHGHHDFDYMGDAGVICADGQILTARWVFENAKLRGGPLVCLAACQTGLMDYKSMPHEVFGLPTAFLKAGASAVLSTLWPVNDSATRLLLEEFYNNLKQGLLPTQALQEAQIWLRDLPKGKAPEISNAIRFTQQGQTAPADDIFPFQHPYYWAGFQLHRA